MVEWAAHAICAGLGLPLALSRGLAPRVLSLCALCALFGWPGVASRPRSATGWRVAFSFSAR
eukprot:550527-Alexandrium_andersonii.AAC.1